MFRTHLGWFLFWCLLTPVLIGIVALLIWRMQLSRTRLQMQGRRIVYRTGLMSTRETEIRAEDVRDIEITKTFWQRVTNSGTLELSTSGDTGREIIISGLRQPERVRDLINECRP